MERARRGGPLQTSSTPTCGCAWADSPENIDIFCLNLLVAVCKQIWSARRGQELARRTGAAIAPCGPDVRAYQRLRPGLLVDIAEGLENIAAESLL
jgi:hypothetical protein